VLYLVYFLLLFNKIILINQSKDKYKVDHHYYKYMEKIKIFHSEIKVHGKNKIKKRTSTILPVKVVVNGIYKHI